MRQLNRGLDLQFSIRFSTNSRHPFAPLPSRSSSSYSKRGPILHAETQAVDYIYWEPFPWSRESQLCKKRDFSDHTTAPTIYCFFINKTADFSNRILKWTPLAIRRTWAMSSADTRPISTIPVIPPPISSTF